MTKPFDAKAARAKRPLPLWVDAFVRDTALLEADEVGAYMNLLMAMWTSRDVALPNDARGLARAARVTTRLWNSRIGPALEGFLSPCAEGVTQKRLREEATYVERQVTQQSDRKNGEKTRKPLKNNKPTQSADTSVDTPADQPTQQPNNPTLEVGSGSAREVATSPAEQRADLLAVMGVDSSGVVGPNGKFLGTASHMATYHQWRDDLGLDHSQIIEVIREVIATKPEPGPPSTFSYFTPAMQRLAGDLRRPTLTPIDGGKHHGKPSGPAHRDPHARALAGMAAAFGETIAEDRTGRGGTDGGD